MVATLGAMAAGPEVLVAGSLASGWTQQQTAAMVGPTGALATASQGGCSHSLSLAAAAAAAVDKVMEAVEEPRLGDGGHVHAPTLARSTDRKKLVNEMKHHFTQCRRRRAGQHRRAVVAF